MTFSPSYKASALAARQKSRNLIARLREERLANKTSAAPAQHEIAPAAEPVAPCGAPVAVKPAPFPQAEPAPPENLGAEARQARAQNQTVSAESAACPTAGESAQDPLVEAIALAVGRALDARAETVAPVAQNPEPETLALLRKVMDEFSRARTCELAPAQVVAAEPAPLAAEAVATQEPVLPANTAPAVQALEAAAPVVTADSRPASVAPAPAPASLPLERLTMLGPGLRWRLAQLGYGGVDDLAKAEADVLRARLGEIGRLVNVETWIEAARALLASEGR